MFRLAACVLLLFLLTYQIVAQASSSSILAREEAPSNCVDGCSKRTLFTIIRECLSTTIICAWTAVHPNIPPREGPFKGTLRRLELMFWAIVAPEILPCWALNQRLAAMTVRDIYNEGKGYKPEKHGIWQSLKGFFSLYEIIDAHNPAWTLKHGHFLIMGGIHLVEPVDPDESSGAERVADGVDVEARNASSVNRDMERGRTSGNYPRITILTLEMLRELVKDPEFKIPLTEAQIMDRSKGDALSKLIFILQSSWFLVQCLARHIQGLDLAQLELTTVALASLNGITLMLWWNKPLGAQTPVRVLMKRKLTDAERDAARHGSQSERSMDDLLGSFESCLFPVIKIVLCCSGRNIFVDWLVILPFALIRLLLWPIITFSLVFYFTIADLLGGSNSFPADATHVPTFYVPDHGETHNAFHFIILLTCATIFGGIHCAGWNFPFPTYTEQKLWRIASLAITIIPVCASLVVATTGLGSSDDSTCLTIFMIIIVFGPLLIAMLGYAPARLILLGQALALLRHLPPGAFIAIEWINFYPHFL